MQCLCRFNMSQAHSIIALINQAKFRLHGDMAMAIVRTFSARGVTSIGSFVLVVVLGRLYGTVGVGVFALAQSLVFAASLLSRYGMDNALMRFVGRDAQSPDVYIYFHYAVIRALSVSSVIGIIIFFSRSLWAQLFHSPELPPVLIGIAIATPAFALSFILAGFMNAVRRPATACLLSQGTIALVTAGVVVVFSQWVLPAAGSFNIGIAYAVGAWIVVGQGLWLCRRWFVRRPIGLASAVVWPDLSGFKRSSSAFFASDLAQFMISVLGIWVAGYLLSNSDVGLFKAANQLAMLIGIILYVLNAILPPRFAKLFHDGNNEGLGKLARQGVLLGLGLAVGPVLLCLIASEWILGVIGHGFPEAATALRILAVGQLIAVGCGSVGHVLNMTARETLQRNIAWLANGTGLLAITALTPLFGVPGTAIGIVVAIIFRKFAGLYFVWRQVGIWMLPIPNMLQVLGIPTVIPLPPVVHDCDGA